LALAKAASASRRRSIISIGKLRKKTRYKSGG
jgi:hypothetical protein